MAYISPCQRLHQIETRRIVLYMGMIASIILMFQYLALPNRNIFFSLLAAAKLPALGKNSLGTGDSPPKFVKVVPLIYEMVNSTHSSIVIELVNNTKGPEEEFDQDNRIQEEMRSKTEFVGEDEDPDANFELDNDREPGDGSLSRTDVDLGRDPTSHNARDGDIAFTLKKASASVKGMSEIEDIKTRNNSALDVVKHSYRITTSENASSSSADDFTSSPFTLSSLFSNLSESKQGNIDVILSDPVISASSNTSPTGRQTTQTPNNSEDTGPLNVLGTLSGNSTVVSFPPRKKGGLPRKTISEMSHILLQTYVSSLSMKPRWSSTRDKELIHAKAQIENAPIVKEDPQLYASLFRNISRFKRSYELMERILRVYVYKDGEKPIFHDPKLAGVYASEGWFMKLMEKSKRFAVKDPRKAHMFYLPFSALKLRFTLSEQGLNRKGMAAYLKNYVDALARKYPFWNRTGGADHFLAACHDWAPFETRQHLGTTIRALCNADLSGGFKLGKDVSFPVTSVRSAGNPLRDIGGMPPSQRPTLAFYSGNRHGWLREILLFYWENKDPTMQISGPMPGGIQASKMAYIQHMKTSKYCICPRGYEVHSPRVVEAIFYECVPVIISDNYVPPFFEIFDWEAFAIFVAEKDIPKLKDILLSISDEKYITMQIRVKKVQQHFLWHADPVKYDVFHMSLHSVWFNRLHQIRIR